MALKRVVRRLLDLRQHMFVIMTLDYFTKCDARGETEYFPASEHLARKLVEECQALFVGSVFAEPCDWMMKGGSRDHAARDRNKDLELRNVVQKYFQTARPVMEFAVGVWHEVGVRLDLSAWEDEQRASVLEMADRLPDNLHSSHCVPWIGCKNGVFTDVREMFEKWDVTNDGLVIVAIDMR